jgi:hypothetical protein
MDSLRDNLVAAVVAYFTGIARESYSDPVVVSEAV